MPRGDRTGPMGAGPRTGRGFGRCGGYDAPGYATPGYGFGPGWGQGRGGWGGGFGWGRRSFAAGPLGWDYPHSAPPPKEETLQALRSDADWLKGQLDAINKRIEELEK